MAAASLAALGGAGHEEAASALQGMTEKGH